MEEGDGFVTVVEFEYVSEDEADGLAEATATAEPDPGLTEAAAPDEPPVVPEGVAGLAEAPAPEPEPEPVP